MLLDPFSSLCSYTDTRSITKYTTAGQALAAVLKKFVPEITAGKKVLELCVA